jgi:hypothetical protein
METIPMGETKTVQKALSQEAIQLINEIWELMGHISGTDATPEQVRAATQGKDEYQLRKLALQLREQWRTPSKSGTTPKQGGEGTTT